MRDNAPRVRVAILSEFYPRARDPVLGIWAHRQAVAARDAGADVRVLVLDRRIPPRAEPHKLRALRQMVAEPRHAERDGIAIEYVPFVSPPRPGHYASWGAWAAPTLWLALGRLRRRWPFDLVHAHNAVPAGAAFRGPEPLVVSVHGGDVLYTAPRHGPQRIREVFERAALVLANSAGIEERARALGARDTRVVHLGTDVPAREPPHDPGLLVTVGHLVARKRHADVLRALARLPEARYLIVGDGPEREPLERLAAELGVGGRVEFAGQLPHEEALARARGAGVFVMPSVDEAFGVAYVEAMAAGLPAIGGAGEPGPQEIAGLGGGIELVPPDDAGALAAALERVLGARGELGRAARATAERHFTWAACGAATVAAYEQALDR